jgi:PAS domain S-box-containing protein
MIGPDTQSRALSDTAWRPGETELRTMFELAPIGLAQFDPSGRFLQVNERLCEILGCTRAHALEHTFQELTFPEDLSHCLQLTARLAAREIPSYCIEKRFIRPDGTAVWTRITVSAARGPDGGVDYFIGAAEDITAHKEATQALELADERLRTSVDASGIGTFRFDVRRNEMEWSDGMERVFGSSTDVKLEDFFARMHPDDREKVMTAYTRSAQDGSDFEEEFRAIWPDGSVHWLHDRARMFPGDDGKPEYIIGAITDVTRFKHLEEALRQNERRLSDLLAREQAARRASEHARSLREEVLGLVAHDLRNPVHTILMASGAVLEIPLAAEEKQKQLELIKRSAWGMERLITDLLDVTRIDAGTFAVKRAPIEVAPIIAEVTASFRERAATAGISLTGMVSPELPSIVADHQRLVQALSNLVSNALRFTNRGGHVEVGARLDGVSVHLTVTDDGAGIASEHLPAVFDRFWQADRTSGGAGLGLAIVKGIVESHGGAVHVDSRVGHGSTFRLTVPALSPDVPSDP